jgi:hypothetical protein
MATVLKPVADEKRRPSGVLLPDDELRRRNLAAIALLDKWEREGDEQEQAETMEVIRETLGEKRIGSNRPMFP